MVNFLIWAKGKGHNQVHSYRHLNISKLEGFKHFQLCTGLWPRGKLLKSIEMVGWIKILMNSFLPVNIIQMPLTQPWDYILFSSNKTEVCNWCMFISIMTGKAKWCVLIIWSSDCKLDFQEIFVLPWPHNICDHTGSLYVLADFSFWIYFQHVHTHTH